MMCVLISETCHSANLDIDCPSERAAATSLLCEMTPRLTMSMIVLRALASCWVNMTASGSSSTAKPIATHKRSARSRVTPANSAICDCVKQRGPPRRDSSMSA